MFVQQIFQDWAVCCGFDDAQIEVESREQAGDFRKPEFSRTAIFDCIDGCAGKMGARGHGCLGQAKGGAALFHRSAKRGEV